VTLEGVHNFRARLKAMSPLHRRRVLLRMGPAAVYNWAGYRARDSQVIPLGAWFLWLICAGRGFGKTRTGAESIRFWVEH